MRTTPFLVFLSSGLLAAFAWACGSSEGGGASEDGGAADAAIDRGSDAPSPADGGADVAADSPVDAASDADAGPQKACTAGGNECAADEYCEAADCATGTCAKRPASADVEKPVCGCDGVSYWNGGLAATAGVVVKTSGACTAGGKICGGIAGFKCPSGATCVMEGADKNVCLVADGSGKCWGMPAMCPAVQITNLRSCTKKTCSGRCDAMKSGDVFYPDNTCPQ